jgi:hypothetical protein
VKEHPRERVRELQPRTRKPRCERITVRIRHHEEKHKILGPAKKNDSKIQSFGAWYGMPRLDGTPEYVQMEQEDVSVEVLDTRS